MPSTEITARRASTWPQLRPTPVTPEMIGASTLSEYLALTSDGNACSSVWFGGAGRVLVFAELSALNPL